MIDKLNNINAGNAQNKRATEDSKTREVNTKPSQESSSSSEISVNSVEISSELNVRQMSAEAPIDSAKVSAIKEAISKGDYPVDLDKVADALLQAYSDIK